MKNAFPLCLSFCLIPAGLFSIEAVFELLIPCSINMVAKRDIAVPLS